MEKKVHLTGHMDVPSDCIDAVSIALSDHIALTRAEAGCLSFDVAPCLDVKGRFLVAETFKNRAAFDHHQERTGKSAWAGITKGFSRIYEITEE